MEDNRQKYDRRFTQLLGLGVIEDLTGESLAEARLLLPFYFLFSFTEMPHLASGQVDLGRSVKNGYTQLLFLSIFSPFLHTQSSARAHTHTHTRTRGYMSMHRQINASARPPFTHMRRT